MRAIGDARTACLLVAAVLAAACSSNNRIAEQGTPTRSPIPSLASTQSSTPLVIVFPGPTATSSPPTSTTSPTVMPGSPEDFSAFASRIEQALKDGRASFFREVMAHFEWACMGDETVGVCKGRGQQYLGYGIPVTRDWDSYTLSGSSDYEHAWQVAFDKGTPLTLVAIANQFGDNPLMPGADQSFQAIITEPAPGTSLAASPVHVLYFAFYGGAWELNGELIALSTAADWLGGDCSICYDTWSPWPSENGISH